MKLQIWNIFREKPKFYPNNKINNLRKLLGIGKGLTAMKLELSKNLRNKKVSKFITTIRLGTAESGSKLIRKELIDDCTGNKCLHCGENQLDNLIHWITNCKAFETIRKSYLAELIEIFKAANKENAETILVSHLVKGKLKNNLPKTLLKNYENKVLAFMSELATIRENKLKSAIASFSSRETITNNVIDISDAIEENNTPSKLQVEKINGKDEDMSEWVKPTAKRVKILIPEKKEEKRKTNVKVIIKKKISKPKATVVIKIKNRGLIKLENTKDKKDEENMVPERRKEPRKTLKKKPPLAISRGKRKKKTL